ncbi:hypothetical protein PR048_029228 [Dryococelus australis]|uniref:Uncharacterized protein n=1 Tax=Dryococelus australis TaxID=614101 RepID=A0ABQ9GDG2_9NEOP|nr:hypothetical protein PR048_029228 [Dryococelus australis]
MEQRRNARARETRDPRENPPASGIVRHDSDVQMLQPARSVQLIFSLYSPHALARMDLKPESNRRRVRSSSRRLEARRQQPAMTPQFKKENSLAYGNRERSESKHAYLKQLPGRVTHTVQLTYKKKVCDHVVGICVVGFGWVGEGRGHLLLAVCSAEHRPPPAAKPRSGSRLFDSAGGHRHSTPPSFSPCSALSLPHARITRCSILYFILTEAAAEI